MENLFNNDGMIISAERYECSETENALRSANLVHDILNIVGWDARVIPANGVYEGIEEQSYIVVYNKEILGDINKIRDITMELLLLALENDQDAVIVFSPENARLLEIPHLIIDDVPRESAREALHMVYMYSGGTLLSDPMYFEEVDESEVYMWDIDHTEVNGRYYTLKY